SESVPGLERRPAVAARGLAVADAVAFLAFDFTHPTSPRVRRSPEHHLGRGRISQGSRTPWRVGTNASDRRFESSFASRAFFSGRTWDRTRDLPRVKRALSR